MEQQFAEARLALESNYLRAVSDPMLHFVEIHSHYEPSCSAKEALAVLLARAVAHRSALRPRCHPDLVEVAWA